MNDRPEQPESTRARRRRRAGGAPGPQPRLEDVAHLAGVSTATVSRVLNGRSIVTERLRESVLQAVADLGYVPHGAARALASRRTHTVGAVIPTLDHAIFARCVQALQSRLYEAGFTLLLASTDYDEERECRQVQSLVGRGIDGLMLVGEAHDASVYALLKSKAIPYVNTWLYHADSRHACIGFDNHDTAQRVASYLLDLGHRRIAMIAGVTAGNDRASARVEGVRAALAERGLDLPAHYLVEACYDLAEGRIATRRLLEAPRAPSAILCGEDILAMGALLECRERGIAVPRTLSVTGFDDLDLAASMDPPLTTVRVPSAEMGRGAAEYLLACLGETPAVPRQQLEATLVIRESTAPPPD